MTAESRQESVATHNASACPVVSALSQVGTPWRLDVVYPDVVARRMEADAPVAVYYDPTEKERELSRVLDELGAWARRWGEEVPAGPNPWFREE